MVGMLPYIIEMIELLNKEKYNMHYRKLGKTELEVSEIALGSEGFVGVSEEFALNLSLIVRW